jgi:hypothetical protein
MPLTQGQRFIYILAVLLFITISALALLSLYSVEAFIILLIIEFLVVQQVTEPAYFKASWRRSIAFFIVLGVILFAIIVYQRFLQL